MTEQQALLAAIISEPDEDMPRLAYADWLAENGDPDHGEFIRLSIQLWHLENVVISPADAMELAGSQSVRNYLMQSPTLADLRTDALAGVTNPNAEYGLPVSLCGIGVRVVEGAADTEYRTIDAFRLNNRPTRRKINERLRELLLGSAAPGEYGVNHGRWFGEYTAAFWEHVQRGFLHSGNMTATQWVMTAETVYWHPSKGVPCPTSAQPIREVTIDDDSKGIQVTVEDHPNHQHPHTMVVGTVRVGKKVWRSQSMISSHLPRDIVNAMQMARRELHETMNLERLLKAEYPGVEIRVIPRYNDQNDSALFEAVVSGTVGPGDMVYALPDGRVTNLAGIVRHEVEQIARRDRLIQADDTAEWIATPMIPSGSPEYVVQHIHNTDVWERVVAEDPPVPNAAGDFLVNTVMLTRQDFMVQGARYRVYLGRCPACNRAYLTEPRAIAMTGHDT